jgi:hypothetical protein
MGLKYFSRADWGRIDSGTHVLCSLPWLIHLIWYLSWPSCFEFNVCPEEGVNFLQSNGVLLLSQPRP